MLLSNTAAPFTHTRTHAQIYITSQSFLWERVKNWGIALANTPTTNSSIWTSSVERFAWPVRFHTLPVPDRNVQETCRILEYTPRDAWCYVQSTNRQTKGNDHCFCLYSSRLVQTIFNSLMMNWSQWGSILWMLNMLNNAEYAVQTLSYNVKPMTP